MIKTFWFVVMISIIIWYIFIAFSVGVRGYRNIVDMLKELRTAAEQEQP